MTSREQFEEWFSDGINEGMKVSASGGYENLITQTAWMAWQASRAAVEIELPDIEDKKWHSSWHGKFRAEAFWLETRRVLNGYGLKVKK